MEGGDFWTVAQPASAQIPSCVWALSSAKAKGKNKSTHAEKTQSLPVELLEQSHSHIFRVLGQQYLNKDYYEKVNVQSDHTHTFS